MGGRRARAGVGVAGLTVHWDAVPANVQATLRRISTWRPCVGFYLAGGTALALLEGHRVSVDLDLFSESFTDAERLVAELSAVSGDLVITSTAARTVFARVDGVQVTFFGYSYPLLTPPVEVEAGIVPLASAADIGAMKLAAIASRGARKDFVDLWLILARHHGLAALLDVFKRKFATRDLGHIVRSLVYFADADEEPPLPTRLDVSWTVMKRDLERWVAELVTQSR
jgi:hypothetical protein